jgi:hypothetical protein
MKTLRPKPNPLLDSQEGSIDYCSFAYSSLACFRTGRLRSASFQPMKKFSYSIFAFAALSDSR